MRVFFARRSEERSRAEELAQDTFLAMFRAVERYEPRALFRAYRYGIALRVLRAERRRARLRALLFLPSASKEPASHVADEEVESDVRSNSISIHEAAKQPPSGRCRGRHILPKIGIRGGAICEKL